MVKIKYEKFRRFAQHLEFYSKLKKLLIFSSKNNLQIFFSFNSWFENRIRWCLYTTSLAAKLTNRKSKMKYYKKKLILLYIYFVAVSDHTY